MHICRSHSCCLCTRELTDCTRRTTVAYFRSPPPSSSSSSASSSTSSLPLRAPAQLLLLQHVSATRRRQKIKPICDRLLHAVHGCCYFLALATDSSCVILLTNHLTSFYLGSAYTLPVFTGHVHGRRSTLPIKMHGPLIRPVNTVYAPSLRNSLCHVRLVGLLVTQFSVN